MSEEKKMQVVDDSDDRVMKDVVAPPRFPLTVKELFPDGVDGKPDVETLRAHLLKEGRLSEEAITALVHRAAAVLKEEPNVLQLDYPVTVCGDVHGQFFDLVRLFEVGGNPFDTQYLFLGDYVDRGCFSSECVFLLFALKITNPKRFYMLRGNHECRQLTEFFNFRHECMFKYNQKIYDTIMDSFDHLPLAAIVNKSFFCVHGGLSPDISTIDEIKDIDRHQEVPRQGPMCDLLWADPYDEESSKDPKNDDNSDSDDDAVDRSWFGYNKTRQCSYMFGINAVRRFLEDNDITSIIRAHEAQVDGYKMQMVNRETGIPRVITIFSAPNYCDVYGNKAACLKFDNNVLNIKQFVDSPHPYYLPHFMDVFAWSLPFVAEKVTDMLAALLDYDDGASSDEDQPAPPVESKLSKKRGMFKKKVLAVTKVLRMYRILRQENESIARLKQLTPNHKVPIGLIGKGPLAIHAAVKDFESARAEDLKNEKMPGSKKAPTHQRRTSRKFSKDSATKLGLGGHRRNSSSVSLKIVKEGVLKTEEKKN